MRTKLSCGARLRRFREKRGLGLRAAARQLHVSHPALRFWETNATTPSGPYRDAIELWTDGDIRAQDWGLTPREAQVAGQLAGVDVAQAQAGSTAALVPAVDAAKANGTEG